MYDYLHMGNGERSKANCYDLINDLTKAFDNLCVLQQMSMHQVRELTDIEKKAELNDIRDMKSGIEDTAVRIFMQLTGCKEYRELTRLAQDKSGAQK